MTIRPRTRPRRPRHFVVISALIAENLPYNINRILLENTITGNHLDIFRNRLSNYKPVKRIPVVKGKFHHFRKMRQS